MNMKKISIIILFVITLSWILSLGVSAETGPGFYFADNADLISDSEEDEITSRMSLIADKRGWNIVIVTLVGEYYESGAKSMLDEIYREQYGDTPGAGYIMTTEVDQPAGQNDYALYIQTYGGIRLQDSSVLTKATNRFIDYDEYGSAMAFLDGCVPYQRPGIDLSRLFFPGLLFAGIPAAIFASVVVARYKSHPKISATRYLDQNETRFYRREDIFVREYTTRTHIERSSGGSSRGGGGFSGGGSSGRR
jgi:uncharacterized membrane protein YgcG